MSVIRVCTEPGRLNDGVRGDLAEALTAATLAVEVGADTDAVRPGIMVLFDEMPKDRWAVGGKFDDTYSAPGGRILITLDAMEGVWTEARRKDLIERYSQAAANAVGSDTPIASCWVIIREIRDGSWGAMGTAVKIENFLPLGFTEDRAADARRTITKRSQGEPK